MSRPLRPPRSQRRLLSEEDEALWRSVARTLEPVRKKPRETGVRADRQDEQDSPRPWALPDRIATNPVGPRMPERDLSRTAHRTIVQDGRRETPEFDRRQARRLAAGRLEIEARLDLHGMRAHAAHAALRAFILGSCRMGRRLVLVITGKGEAADRGQRPFELSSGLERGVLKRSVPAWLAEPELGAVIVSFTTAHPRHGGEGALYVQLRSRRRELG